MRGSRCRNEQGFGIVVANSTCLEISYSFVTGAVAFDLILAF